MAFTVIYDACVLYPVVLRDLFIRLGQTDLFRAKLTSRILDEMERSLLLSRPELKESLTRQRALMLGAIRDVEVRGYETLMAGVPVLPDDDDRHVVAAAMKSGAEVIVTFNLADFPGPALLPLGIEAQHPDVFVQHLVDLDRDTVVDAVERMVSARRSPPMSYDEVLDSLGRLGLTTSAEALRMR